ncbi:MULTISPECIES: PhoH family protein [Pseudomonas]|uniref:PhoH family protein n=1 Tax=Pseudomonas TaxID=286 RepID=UPI0012416B69|nr:MULTISPECIES: PhoH family protein [Pseudomonas]MBP5946592.1 PhoH family protein [Pseudomonas sp. P9(2020)]MBP5953078.1 PhoH family protein [Pseudomonas sp. P42]MBP5958215.1 PhoH family protein [Pseudomonas anatoliensis]MBP5966534.1 PhoH family protein [Pseudomonas iridis]MBZ9564731.1 PhoH family protein [Pseudomonas sp. P116]
MDDHGRSPSNQPILYVLDTNVLIHDPNALLNFEEHHVAIPMTVLEELDKLKSGHHSVAAECRQAIRLIDKTLGDASPEDVELGVPIQRGKGGPKGLLSILMSKQAESNLILPEHLNDNKIINQLIDMHTRDPQKPVVLVTKDINMRLKARACGIAAEDYSTDQLVDDVSLLPNGYHNMTGSFWDLVSKVETRQDHGRTWHEVKLIDNLPAVHINEFIIDEQGFVGWIKEIDEDRLLILDLHQEPLLHQEAWGLKPRDIYQSLALYALLDPDIHLVNLSGAAGSGKTILALAAAIEQTMVSKRYRRIIATRSVQGLDQEIGFLPGTEAEKMEPWLGAITDNLEALHMDDENTHGSVDYILSKVPLQFKSLNYIRGRSFQQSLILIDECQNLTPHQMKTIITRAGAGSKVVCLGNLAQIDTPYLSATSSGLTYLTERFKDFPNGVHITLQGVPRSILAEYAETHL